MCQLVANRRVADSSPESWIQSDRHLSGIRTSMQSVRPVHTNRDGVDEELRKFKQRSFDPLHEIRRHFLAHEMGKFDLHENRSGNESWKEPVQRTIQID